jgi:hypothetical protein
LLPLGGTSSDSPNLTALPLSASFTINFACASL